MKFSPRKQHIYHQANIQGQDYIVGDLHGEVDALKFELERVGFNYETDRLFCTGDIIDKGDTSIDCLNLLTEKWFYAVLGNHEQLFLKGFESSKYWQMMQKQGGEWITPYLDRLDLLMRWKTLIDVTMPLARTIEFAGKTIGISHANTPLDWQHVQSGELSEHDIWQLLWHRPLDERKPWYSVSGVDAVVHGHDPVPWITQMRNRYWIETFTHNKKLTVVRIDFFFPELQLAAAGMH
ncbi:metallophosphoesterase [Shewanella sp. WXL01]|uniref:Metallophosphoesterase n=1 Tax=Shewanella maritima TaxID=2520507 RepID=A0A411PH70_9GAMM|nr:MULTISPECIES: metallophosphoesterase [Shewanella]NKF49043.1 metallophosphoesterase [Shewanella sp. WXL01]QBF82814.1 metallophosphoesterase [Shewanella maritima]